MVPSLATLAKDAVVVSRYATQVHSVIRVKFRLTLFALIVVIIE